MMVSHVVAGAYNAKRTKRHHRYFQFSDFHPHHNSTNATKSLSGRQVVSDTIAWYHGDQIQWLPGWGPDKFQQPSIE